MNSNSFDKLNDWIRDTENSFVNFLSAFAPWLAPLIPAYMTFQHAKDTLKFPVVFAWTGALVVEILGFSAVSTYLSFWFYNRRNRAESKRAPIILVIVAFAFYLTLIIFSNVLLDTFPDKKWAEIAVRALFTLQTIPAAMLVSVRTQHRELLSEIAKERRNMHESSQNYPKNAEKSSESFGKFPKDWRSLEPTLTKDQLEEIASLTPEKMRVWATQIGVTEKTISNWRQSARERLGK